MVGISHHSIVERFVTQQGLSRTRERTASSYILLHAVKLHLEPLGPHGVVVPMTLLSPRINRVMT